MSGRRSSADLAQPGQPDWGGLRELTDRVTSPGASVKAAAGLEVNLGKLGKWADREARYDEQLRQITNMPLPANQIPLTGGAGILNLPDLYGPHEGFAWDIRYIIIASFTAGTVTVYNTVVADEYIEGQATAPGMIRWGGDLILNDTENLVFVASGITGAVSVRGRVNQMPNTIEPKYII